MTIAEIKKMLESSEAADLPQLLASLEGDSRAGVKKLVEYYKRWYNKACDENKRLVGLRYFEERYKSFGHICGVDEAGAGPLAGPVAAAAVILPKGCLIEGINDSKKLSAKKRSELARIIKQKAVAWHVALLDNECIDAINILQARLKVMAAAVDGLAVTPGFVLFDGDKAPATKAGLPHAGLIGGDAKSISIAAASILAKVERDAVMDDFNEIYPEYGFDRNKGYGTAEHLTAIKKHGITPIHRRSFLEKYL